MLRELTGEKPVTDKMNYYENFDLDSKQKKVLNCEDGVESEYQEKD